MSFLCPNLNKERLIIPKRKATKAELEYGIGIEDIEEDGIEPEIDDNDDQVVALACDEENDIDDDELIKEFHRTSVPGNDVWEEGNPQ